MRWLGLLVGVSGFIGALLWWLLADAPRGQNEAEREPAAAGAPTAWTPAAPAPSAGDVARSEVGSPQDSGEALSTDRLLLFGAIRNAEGGAIEHAAITLHRLLPEAGLSLGNGEGDFHRQTGAAYAFDGLAAGEWKVSVQAHGHIGVEGRLELSERLADQPLDFALQRSRLLPVRLETTEGKSLVAELRERFASLFATRNLRVVATHRPLPWPLVPAWSEEPRIKTAGKFHDATTFQVQVSSPVRIPSGSDGLLELPGPATVSVALLHGAVLLAAAAVGPDAQELVLRTSMQAFQDSCVDLQVQIQDAESGEALAGAGVRVGGRRATCDADGRAILDFVPRGIASVECTSPDHERVRAAVRVGPEGAPALAPLRMERTVEVRGQVVDADGQGIPAALLVASLDHWTFPQRLPSVWNRGAQDDGRFELELGRGRYLLFPLARDAASPLLRSGLEPVLVDTTRGAVDQVQIVARPGTAVTLLPAFDLPHALLGTVFDARGLPLWAEELVDAEPRRIDLVPGTYSLRLEDLDGPRSIQDFEVGAESHTLVARLGSLLPLEDVGETLPDLLRQREVLDAGRDTTELDPQVILLGEVLLAGGAPAEGPGEDSGARATLRVHAELVDAEGRVTVARVEGTRFSFASLVPGDHRLYVRATGHVEAQRRVSITPSPAVRRITVPLTAKHTVRVRLQTRDGRSFLDALTPEQRFRLRARVTLTRDAQSIAEPVRGRILGRAGTAEPTPELSVDALPPFHVSFVEAGEVIATRAVEAAAEEVVLILDPEDLARPPATLSFRVVDAADGTPMNDARAGIEGRGRQRRPLSTNIDAQGRQRLELVADEYTLNLFQAGYEVLSIQCPLEAGQQLDLGDLRLRPAARSVLKLRDLAGNAVGTAVQLFELDGPPGRLSSSPVFMSTKDGVLDLFPVAEGRYELRVIDREWPMQSFTVQVRAGEEKGPELVLQTGTEVSVLVDVDSDEALRLRALDPRGVECALQGIRAHRRATLALIPGTYTLQLSLRDEVLATEEVAVGQESMQVRLRGE